MMTLALRTQSVRSHTCISSLVRRLLLPLALLLGLASAADAAELPKIIYVRPVPMNDDVLLQQGSSGVNNAAKLYKMQASTLESQATRAGRLQQLDNAVKQGAKIVVVMGFVVGPVHSRPPDQPQSPDSPR